MTSPETGATPKDVAPAVDTASRFVPLVRLSMGIVLKAKPVPRAVMMGVVKRVKMPTVPTVEVQTPEGGTRMEENPNDPDYLDAVEAVHVARLEATYRAAYALGTEVVTIPEGVFGPDDDGWMEQLALFGLEPDVSSPTARYLAWLDNYALATQQDKSDAYGACLAATGIMEMEVIEAVAYFRNRAERRTVGNPSPVDNATDGDHVPAAAAGTGDGVRGTGSGELLPIQVDRLGSAAP